MAKARKLAQLQTCPFSVGRLWVPRRERCCVDERDRDKRCGRVGRRRGQEAGSREETAHVPSLSYLVLRTDYDLEKKEPE